MPLVPGWIVSGRKVTTDIKAARPMMNRNSCIARHEAYVAINPPINGERAGPNRTACVPALTYYSCSMGKNHLRQKIRP